MATRSYRQYCAVARALDVLGDRWTLLVLRELLDGPRRYADLLAGLQSISTDILARRLRELEDAGLVERDVLPPPAASRVYRLTASGREVEPVIASLARFGFERLGARRADDAADPRWLALAVRTLLAGRRPTKDLTIRFETPEGAAAVCITGDGVHPCDGAGADVVLTGSMEALARAVDPDPATARAAMRDLEVAGSPATVRALQALFRGPAPG